MRKKSNKFLAVLLALMMVAVFVPTFSFAADRSDTITVFMTVSDKGQVVETSDHAPMVSKAVVVSDLDDDGHYSFDEALVAAHATYNDPSGYSFDGAMVQKLWGVETSGDCYFFTNDVSLSSGVADSEVQEGDFLTAAAVVTYGDWYASFGKMVDYTEAGKAVSLNLSGKTIAYGSTATTAFEGADIYANGVKVATTDANGNASVTFEDEGTYVITADKLSSPVAVDLGPSWYLIEFGRDADDNVYYGHVANWDYTNYEAYVAYTEDEYENGPYPFDEIEWIDQYDFDIEEWTEEDGYLLYSSEVYNLPVIAPACIINVEKGSTTGSVKEILIDKLGTEIDLNNYKEAQKIAVLFEIINGSVAINAAATADEAQAAYDAAIEAINGIITAAEYDAQAAKTVAGFKVTKGKKKATVKWTADSSNFEGYEVYYKPAGKAAKTVKTTNAKYVVKGLKSKKKCTFKVRGYKTVKGVVVPGAWSKAKTVKIK